MPAVLLLGHTGAEERRRSLVLDFEPGRAIAVGVPLERGTEVHVAGGAELGVEVAYGDALHRFRTTVLRRQEVPAPCLFLAWPAGVERVQRRAHRRVALALPARVRLPSTAPEADAPRELAGTTLDLSIGGARVALPEPLVPGDTLALRIEAPAAVGAIVCAARVAHAGEVAPPHDGGYPVGFEFLDLPPTTRRALDHYLIEVQRERLHADLV